MQNPSISLLLLVTLLNIAHGLYFHIGETERKCFIEELPNETAVIINYTAEVFDRRTNGIIPSSSGIGIYVEVHDNEKKIILSRTYSSKGHIAFTSHSPGEHVICMLSNSTNFPSVAQLRIHLKIQIGEHAIDYAKIARKEKLTDLELRALQLLDQVNQIIKEQSYQRYREERFRYTSESTNSHVLWWALLQTLVVISVGLWQMRHLKRFFEIKKLV